MGALAALVVPVAAGTAAAFAGTVVEPPVFTLPVVGAVDAAGVSGSVVSGVGTGGSGFDITLAIISVKPASEPLRNL